MDRSEKGFMLLEVMVALAILSIAFVTIMQLHIKNIDMGNESKNITIATLLAKDKMVEVEMGEYPDVEESEGSFEDQYTIFRWKRSISDTSFSDVREVRITITWMDGKKNVELVQYITQL